MCAVSLLWAVSSALQLVLLCLPSVQTAVSPRSEVSALSVNDKYTAAAQTWHRLATIALTFVFATSISILQLLPSMSFITVRNPLTFGVFTVGSTGGPVWPLPTARLLQLLVLAFLLWYVVHTS